MLRAAATVVAVSFLLIGTFTAEADQHGEVPLASASALTVGGDPVLYAETQGAAATFQRDFDAGFSGGDVSIGYIAIEGSASAADASSRVSARDLSLVGGRVTIESLTMAVAAGPAGTGVTEAAAAGVVVDGSPLRAGPGTRVELAGYGTLVMFEQVVPEAGAVRANALRLEPDGSGSAGAVPASVGNLASAAPIPSPVASAPPPAAPEPQEPVSPPASPPAPPPAPEAEPDPEPDSSTPRRSPGPRPTRPATTAPRPVAPPSAADEESAVPASDPVPRIGLPVRPTPRNVGPPDLGGYVFPVFGDNVAFGNDYGAPRAVTGWHHGNDLFAPTGTPVLAVADGELFMVGVNRLGGNRLWLRDDAGNEFYYAHLSAYTPIAVDGARVRAGEAIGFIGNSGQAITTPPHLHFEIHPGGLDSVNPYPYLLAWQRQTDVPRAFREATVAVGQAPAAGALVIEVTPDRDEAPKSESGLATPVS